MSQKIFFIDFKVCFSSSQSYVYTISYQKHDFPHIHSFQFLNHNDSSIDSFQISNFIKIKLLWADVDNEEKTLDKIAKNYMIHGLYSSHDAKTSCITVRKGQNSKN